jgi:hypothetical protein
MSLHPMSCRRLQWRRSSRYRQGFGGSSGVLMPVGILAIPMMLLGSASLVSLGLSRSRGSAQLTASRDARSVAEAGINRIIASFNQPENRRLLVSGMTMGSWSSDTSNSLQSPCVKTDGTRPGPNGSNDLRRQPFMCSQRSREFKLLLSSDGRPGNRSAGTRCCWHNL